MPRSIRKIYSPRLVAESVRLARRRQSGRERKTQTNQNPVRNRPRKSPRKNRPEKSEDQERPRDSGAVLILRRRLIVSGTPVPMIELVNIDLAAQGITMNAQQARCAGLVSVGAIE